MRFKFVFQPDLYYGCRSKTAPLIQPHNATRSPWVARPTVGFWLGGGLLGTGGLILGACMPYQHPVGVVISALWWGIYLGCLGASVGALIGMCTEHAPARASGRVDGRS